jgi:hypothetical protein
MSSPHKALSVACDERTLLANQYEKASRKYFAAAARELEHRRSLASTHDYEELLRAVEQAKSFTDQAHRALQRHIAEHGCGWSID